MTLRGILPCMRVPRSTTDSSYPVRDRQKNKRDSQKNSKADRQDIQKDRQTDKQTDLRQTDRQTYRQAHTRRALQPNIKTNRYKVDRSTLTVGSLLLEPLDLFEVLGAQDPLAVHAEVRWDLHGPSPARSWKRHNARKKNTHTHTQKKTFRPRRTASKQSK